MLGEAIYYNGEMIQSVFFASSCGYTNSAENVWGVDYPYLRSVDCPLDKTTDPNWGSTDSYSSDYIKNAVQNTLGIALTGDPSKWFKINSRLDNREHGLNSAYGDFVTNSYTEILQSGPSKTSEHEKLVPITLDNSTQTKQASSISKVEVIMKRSRFEAFKEAMNRIGVTGMTVSHVVGCGMQKLSLIHI